MYICGLYNGRVRNRLRDLGGDARNDGLTGDECADLGYDRGRQRNDRWLSATADATSLAGRTVLDHTGSATHTEASSCAHTHAIDLVTTTLAFAIAYALTRTRDDDFTGSVTDTRTCAARLLAYLTSHIEAGIGLGCITSCVAVGPGA